MTAIDEVTRLEAHSRAMENRISVMRGLIRDNNKRIDEIRLAEKPEFPTQAQRDDIAEGLRLLADGYQESSHHGDPVREADWASPVRIAHLNGYWFLSVHHQAPYAKQGGGKLWDFTDADILALVTIVTDLGHVVADRWLHDSGLSILVRPGVAS